MPRKQACHPEDKHAWILKVFREKPCQWFLQPKPVLLGAIGCTSAKMVWGEAKERAGRKNPGEEAGEGVEHGTSGFQLCWIYCLQMGLVEYHGNCRFATEIKLPHCGVTANQVTAVLVIQQSWPSRQLQIGVSHLHLVDLLATTVYSYQKKYCWKKMHCIQYLLANFP